MVENRGVLKIQHHQWELFGVSKKKKERKKNTEIGKQIGESDIQVGLSTFTVVVDGNGDTPPCLIGVIWICSPCQ